MALSATFTANFSSFYDAVDKANVKLKSFGDGADKVGGRLNTFANQFSGQKIVQEATIMAKAVEEIGGVSKLTEKELARLGATTNEAVQKMKLLGMDVPKNLQAIADKTKGAGAATTDWMGTLTKVGSAVGIAFSVGAIKDFIGSVFDAAGAVKDLSDQWGVSTKAVQQWSAAVQMSGVEQEMLGKSVQFVTEKLAETSPEYDALLKNIGLSGDALRALPKEEAYREIIAAIGQVTDETLQYDVALGTIGPSAKKMIGAIRDGFLEAADAQAFMSDETIARLEAAGDAWEKFKNLVVIYSGEMLAASMKNIETMSKSWGTFFTWLGKTGMDVVTLGDTASEFLREQQAAADAAAKGLEHTAGAATQAAAAQTGVVRTTAAVTAGVTKHTAATTQAAAAAKQYQERVDELKRGILGLTTVEKAALQAEQELAHEGHAAQIAALLKVDDQTDKVIKASKGFTFEVLKAGEAARLTADKIQGLARAQEGLSLVKPPDWGTLFRNAIPAADLTKGVQQALAKIDTQKLRTGLGLVSTAITAIGQSARGAFGTVMRWVSQATDMVFEYIVAAKAAKLANEAVAASAAVANLSMGVLTLGITTVASLILRDMQAQSTLITRTEQTIDTLKALRDEFGLVAAASGRSSSGREVTGHASVTAAANLLTLLRQAQEAIRGLSDVTERFGGVVPTSLRPMVDELLRMQGLPAALRSQLEGFAAAPAWQTLQTRAQDLGIDLSALGGSFNQKRLADMGFGFFHDIEAFMDQGANLDGVLSGMSDELVGLALEALKTGAALPKSLEPYMDKLREMGLLVDENGNAIGDLTFKDLEDESLKAVVDVLEQIRELLANALPQAVGTFAGAMDAAAGRKRGGMTTGQGIVESVGEGGAFATVDGSAAGPSAGGTMTVVVEADGRQLSRIIAPYVPGEVRRLGLARG